MPIHHLATMLVTSIVIGGCAADIPDAEPIELQPGAGGKEDGATTAAFELSPEHPSAEFRVLCQEWFSCDLEIGLYAPTDTRVTVHAVKSEVVTEFAIRPVQCQVDDRVIETTKLLAPDDVVPATTRCSDIANPRLWSSSNVEVFVIEVAKDTWSDHEWGFSARLWLEWW